MALIRDYIRIFFYLFIIFGLMVALPMIVWDFTSRVVFIPFAAALTALSAFLPIGVIIWFNIEDNPDDTKVPFRLREDAVVRSAIATGLVVGTAVTIWLIS